MANNDNRWEWPRVEDLIDGIRQNKQSQPIVDSQRKSSKTTIDIADTTKEIKETSHLEEPTRSSSKESSNIEETQLSTKNTLKIEEIEKKSSKNNENIFSEQESSHKISAEIEKDFIQSSKKQEEISSDTISKLKQDLRVEDKFIHLNKIDSNVDNIRTSSTKIENSINDTTSHSTKTDIETEKIDSSINKTEKETEYTNTTVYSKKTESIIPNTQSKKKEENELESTEAQKKEEIESLLDKTHASKRENDLEIQTQLKGRDTSEIDLSSTILKKQELESPIEHTKTVKQENSLDEARRVLYKIENELVSKGKTSEKEENLLQNIFSTSIKKENDISIDIEKENKQEENIDSTRQTKKTESEVFENISSKDKLEKEISDKENQTSKLETEIEDSESLKKDEVDIDNKNTSSAKDELNLMKPFQDVFKSEEEINTIIDSSIKQEETIDENIEITNKEVAEEDAKSVIGLTDSDFSIKSNVIFPINPPESAQITENNYITTSRLRNKDEADSETEGNLNYKLKTEESRNTIELESNKISSTKYESIIDNEELIFIEEEISYKNYDYKTLITPASSLETEQGYNKELDFRNKIESSEYSSAVDKDRPTQSLDNANYNSIQQNEDRENIQGDFNDLIAPKDRKNVLGDFTDIIVPKDQNVIENGYNVSQNLRNKIETSFADSMMNSENKLFTESINNNYFYYSTINSNESNPIVTPIKTNIIEYSQHEEYAVTKEDRNKLKTKQESFDIALYRDLKTFYKENEISSNILKEKNLEYISEIKFTSPKDGYVFDGLIGSNYIEKPVGLDTKIIDYKQIPGDITPDRNDILNLSSEIQIFNRIENSYSILDDISSQTIQLSNNYMYNTRSIYDYKLYEDFDSIQFDADNSNYKYIYISKEGQGLRKNIPTKIFSSLIDSRGSQQNEQYNYTLEINNPDNRTDNSLVKDSRLSGPNEIENIYLNKEEILDIFNSLQTELFFASQFEHADENRFIGSGNYVDIENIIYNHTSSVDFNELNKKQFKINYNYSFINKPYLYHVKSWKVNSEDESEEYISSSSKYGLIDPKYDPSEQHTYTDIVVRDDTTKNHKDWSISSGETRPETSGFDYFDSLRNIPEYNNYDLLNVINNKHDDVYQQNKKINYLDLLDLKTDSSLNESESLVWNGKSWILIEGGEESISNNSLSYFNNSGSWRDRESFDLTQEQVDSGIYQQINLAIDYNIKRERISKIYNVKSQTETLIDSENYIYLDLNLNYISPVFSYSEESSTIINNPINVVNYRDSIVQSFVNYDYKSLVVKTDNFIKDWVAQDSFYNENRPIYNFNQILSENDIRQNVINIVKSENTVIKQQTSNFYYSIDDSVFYKEWFEVGTDEKNNNPKYNLSYYYDKLLHDRPTTITQKIDTIENFEKQQSSNFIYNPNIINFYKSVENSPITTENLLSKIFRSNLIGTVLAGLPEDSISSVKISSEDYNKLPDEHKSKYVAIRTTDKREIEYSLLETDGYALVDSVEGSRIRSPIVTDFGEDYIKDGSGLNEDKNYYITGIHDENKFVIYSNNKQQQTNFDYRFIPSSNISSFKNWYGSSERLPSELISNPKYQFKYINDREENSKPTTTQLMISTISGSIFDIESEVPEYKVDFSKQQSNNFIYNPRYHEFSKGYFSINPDASPIFQSLDNYGSIKSSITDIGTVVSSRGITLAAFENLDEKDKLNYVPVRKEISTTTEIEGPPDDEGNPTVQLITTSSIEITYYKVQEYKYKHVVDATKNMVSYSTIEDLGAAGLVGGDDDITYRVNGNENKYIISLNDVINQEDVNFNYSSGLFDHIISRKSGDNLRKEDKNIVSSILFSDALIDGVMGSIAIAASAISGPEYKSVREPVYNSDIMKIINDGFRVVQHTFADQASKSPKSISNITNINAITGARENVDNFRIHAPRDITPDADADIRKQWRQANRPRYIMKDGLAGGKLASTMWLFLGPIVQSTIPSGFLGASSWWNESFRSLMGTIGAINDFTKVKNIIKNDPTISGLGLDTSEIDSAMNEISNQIKNDSSGSEFFDFNNALLKRTMRFLNTELTMILANTTKNEGYESTGSETLNVGRQYTMSAASNSTNLVGLIGKGVGALLNLGKKDYEKLRGNINNVGTYNNVGSIGSSPAQVYGSFANYIKAIKDNYTNSYNALKPLDKKYIQSGKDDYRFNFSNEDFKNSLDSSINEELLNKFTDVNSILEAQYDKSSNKSTSIEDFRNKYNILSSMIGMNDISQYTIYTNDSGDISFKLRENDIIQKFNISKNRWEKDNIINNYEWDLTSSDFKSGHLNFLNESSEYYKEITFPHIIDISQRSRTFYKDYMFRRSVESTEMSSFGSSKEYSDFLNLEAFSEDESIKTFKSYNDKNNSDDEKQMNLNLLSNQWYGTFTEDSPHSIIQDSKKIELTSKLGALNFLSTVKVPLGSLTQRNYFRERTQSVLIKSVREENDVDFLSDTSSYKNVISDGYTVKQMFDGRSHVLKPLTIEYAQNNASIMLGGDTQGSNFWKLNDNSVLNDWRPTDSTASGSIPISTFANTIEENNSLKNSMLSIAQSFDGDKINEMGAIISNNSHVIVDQSQSSQISDIYKASSSFYNRYNYVSITGKNEGVGSLQLDTSDSLEFGIKKLASPVIMSTEDGSTNLRNLTTELYSDNNSERKSISSESEPNKTDDGIVFDPSKKFYVMSNKYKNFIMGDSDINYDLTGCGYIYGVMHSMDNGASNAYRASNGQTSRLVIPFQFDADISSFDRQSNWNTVGAFGRSSDWFIWSGTGSKQTTLKTSYAIVSSNNEINTTFSSNIVNSTVKNNNVGNKNYDCMKYFTERYILSLLAKYEALLVPMQAGFSPPILKIRRGPMEWSWSRKGGYHETAWVCTDLSVEQRSQDAGFTFSRTPRLFDVSLTLKETLLSWDDFASGWGLTQEGGSESMNAPENSLQDYIQGGGLGSFEPSISGVNPNYTGKGNSFPGLVSSRMKDTITIKNP